MAALSISSSTMAPCAGGDWPATPCSAQRAKLANSSALRSPPRLVAGTAAASTRSAGCSSPAAGATKSPHEWAMDGRWSRSDDGSVEWP